MDKLKKKMKYVVIPILIILIGFFIAGFYIEHIYITSLTKLYHYQEGVVLLNQTDESIDYINNDNTNDFSVDIYSNGFYKVSFFEKGTETVNSTKFGKISTEQLTAIQDILDTLKFEDMNEFIFNGYLDGKGYELTTYDTSGIELKNVYGFNLTKSAIEDFDELQQENYADTLDDEVKFVTIRDVLLSSIEL